MQSSFILNHIYSPVEICVTLLTESEVDEDSDAFIGCWWLPFIIWGVVIILGAIGMLLCPKHMPYYYEQKELAAREMMKPGIVKKETKEEKSLKELIKGESRFIK